MTDELLYDVRDHVATVTLNRPRVLNAISHDVDAALARRWDEIDADPDIWVAILAGAGDRAFCSGGDISNGPSVHPDGIALGGGLTGIGGPLRVLRKPLIALVHGYTLGAGFELAMAADIIVAADDTRFGLPEVLAGIIGEAGVVHRAIRQLPHHVAMAMILAGERLDASAALQHGLVNEVVPLEELEETGRRWAGKLVAASPLAQQAAKQAALAGAGLPLEIALSSTYELIEAYSGSWDVAEGAAARREKRPPRWSGR